MVVRLHDLSGWAELQPGHALTFDDGRLIRVEVNTEYPTSFSVLQGSKLTFLANVHGMEVLEFRTEGPAELVATGEGQVWYFTNDGLQRQAYSRPEAKSFTVITMKRARNPQLELMMFRQQQKRLEFEASMQRQLDAMAAQMQGRRVDTDTGEIDESDDAGANGTVPGANDPAAVGGDGGGEQQPTPPPAAKAKKGAQTGV